MVDSSLSRSLVVERRSRQNSREHHIWQRRYWEQQIRDDVDRARIDYIPINPVKHAFVPRVVDWPYSTFHRYVKSDLLNLDWGGETNEFDSRGEHERFVGLRKLSPI